MAFFKGFGSNEREYGGNTKKRDVKSRLLRALPWVIVISVILFVLKGTEYLFLIVLAAVIHEGGHVVFAKIFGVPLSKAQGSFFGVRLTYDFSEKSYLVQIAVSCAGAAFNVSAAALTVLFSGKSDLFSVFFVFSNLALAIFNLMPVSGFDGIGIIKCLVLLMTKEISLAEKICKWISAFFSGAFFLLTVYIQMRGGVSLTMLLLSCFLLYNCLFNENG